MEEHELKVLAKIEALELLATFALASIYELKGISTKQVAEIHEAFLKHAQGVTAPYLDPVLSDHYCAECADALDRLLKVACSLRAIGDEPPSTSEE